MITNIFSTTKHSVGDILDVVDRETGEHHNGIIVELYGNDPKYKVLLISGKVVYTGEDYYKVEIKET